MLYNTLQPNRVYLITPNRQAKRLPLPTTIFHIDGETWRKSELRIKNTPTLQ